MNLSSPIRRIPKIGPVYVKKLHKMGVKTIYDLLFYFPYRYEDFSKITPISQLKLNKTYCVQGKILDIENTRTWRKRMVLTQAIIEDKTGAIKIIWFNQPYLKKTLKKGETVCLAGKVSLGKSGAFLSNPAYEKVYPRPEDGKSGTGLVHTGRIVPVYPETQGLSSRWLRYILKPLLVEFENKIPEILPEKIKKANKFLPIQKALWQIHFPDSMKMAKLAQERFSFQEIFLIELLVLREKMKLAKEKAVSVPLKVEILQRFTKTLPFKLTNAQRKSAWQILKDLERPYPMNRLLQGDVGSGKTVVAVMAALNVVKEGLQATFMAPTEILAKQHFRAISKLLQDFKLDVGILTGKTDRWISKKLKNEPIEISRQKLLEKAKNGKIDILIGTHALIQDKVKFKKLALVVLDEQHRFGVKQRAKLLTKGEKIKKRTIPHLLSMTATPIPRTLALTVYGDLDLSLIDEMPKGRKKIITKVVNPNNRQKAYDFIRKQVKQKKQVFVICPRIEDSSLNSEGLAADMSNLDHQILSKNKISAWAGVKTVKEEYEKLAKEIFPDLKVAMLHGKLGSKEKERIMKNFKNKKTDILVSTSVVEVGIDITNATVMMIEGAERFGLAQLHQFRGRVGRSRHQSFCFLLTDSPSQKTRQRLKALLETNSGFELAEKDLQIRGPGDFHGVRQWGIPDLAMASFKNIALVEKARNTAIEILRESPGLKKYPLLQKRMRKFGEKIHLE